MYFTISNFLNDPITLVDLVFNVSLNLTASTEPVTLEPGGLIQSRFDLGMVTVREPKEQLGIWNDEVVLIIPPKSTQSFKLKYNIKPNGLKGVNAYAYHIAGTYINPKTGALGVLISDTKVNIVQKKSP